MDDVHDLARRTGEEVADWRTTLNNHTETLNTIRENQLDQGKKLASFEKEMHEGFAKVDENFAKVDKNFADVERKFALLHEGQERITDLLTRHLGEPDDEPHTGGADE